MLARTVSLTASLVLFAGCGSESELSPLATKTEVLEKRSTPPAPETKALVIDGSDASVQFAMQAPFERQEGAVPGTSVSGELNVDLRDLRKTRGLVNVDISALVIHQQRAKNEGQYAERSKSDLQNEHMRDWLEIGEDAPEGEAAKNRLVQLSIDAVEDASVTDVLAMSGGERRVTFTALGDFRLHQRTSKKRLRLAATFHMTGDELTRVDVETVQPFSVSLAEHDVRPRTGFGKLAAKTLSAMSPKVAKAAEVSVAVTLVPGQLRA